MNLYSFARPSSKAISQDLWGKQRSLPAEGAQGGYNAIARPQEPWAQEGGRYYTNLTYSIQEVNPEESDGSRLRMTSPTGGRSLREAEERDSSRGLVLELSSEELAVQTSDIGDRDVLGAFDFASTSVRTVTEAQLIHLSDHSLSTAGSFDTTLWEESQLADLSRDEEHSRAVLTSCSAGTATDTSGSVHSHIGVSLRNGDSVSIGYTTGIDRHEATSLDNLVVGRAVYHEVTDDGEASRAPRLDGDRITIVEATHV